MPPQPSPRPPPPFELPPPANEVMRVVVAFDGGMTVAMDIPGDAISILDSLTNTEWERLRFIEHDGVRRLFNDEITHDSTPIGDVTLDHFRFHFLSIQDEVTKLTNKDLQHAPAA